MKSIDSLSSKIFEVIRSKHFGIEGFGDNDYKFMNRIYSEGLNKYKNRLESLSFVNEERVLDAGCGFGQWSIALALLNHEIYSCDICPKRVRFLKETARYLEIDNIQVDVGGVNPTNYKDNYFDSIFCYGVIFLTPWKNTIKEFYRLLKPNGKLYINYTDIGWYLFTWITEHNKADDYDPKQNAANVFNYTLEYERDEESHSDGRRYIITNDEIDSELKKVGFKNVRTSAEGELSTNLNITQSKDFVRKDFHGFNLMNECLAVK